MNIKINRKNYLNLIKGASIFTTGGGVPLEDQIPSIEKLKNIDINLLSLDEFPNDAYICTTAELGPTNVPPLKKEKIIAKMLSLLSKVSGKKIVGLYPPEIGQENVVLESCYFLNLPIADFDPTGFRAVPYIDINVFNLKKLKFSYTPMVISTNRNEIFLIEGNISYERLESILRDMTSLSKEGVIFLLGGIISVKNILKSKIGLKSYTKALRYGKIKDLQELLNSLKPKIKIEATVVKKEEFEKKGFLGEIVHVVDKNNKEYKLIILNEVLFIFDKYNRIVASVPERILLIEPWDLRGLSGVFLERGTRILIAVIDPEKVWKGPRAQEIFGRKRFKDLLVNFKQDDKQKIWKD